MFIANAVPVPRRKWPNTYKIIEQLNKMIENMALIPDKRVLQIPGSTFIFFFFLYFTKKIILKLALF